MAKTFNIELWEKLKEDFLGGNVFFGQAPEDTPAPYCVMYVLSGEEDLSSKTLCRADREVDLQFTIYGFNDMQIDELLDELVGILKGYKLLTSYRIKVGIESSTKNASSFTAEVGAGLTRFNFMFEKL